MADKAAGVARVMSLYRQLLRLHRAKLAGPMRALGDSYVQGEFRSHLRGKTTPQQWQVFGEQWQAYIMEMQGRPDAPNIMGMVNRVMDVMDQLSEKQRSQLEQLKAELDDPSQPVRQAIHAMTQGTERQSADRRHMQHAGQPGVLLQELDKLIARQDERSAGPEQPGPHKPISELGQASGKASSNANKNTGKPGQQ